MSRFRAFLSILLFALAVSPAFAQIYHDPHKKETIGFSVDLTSSPETVAQIVKAIASDGIIRGTHMYAKQNDIDQAEAATSSNAFRTPPGPGQVFYKMKTKVLSPANFPAASDIGTLWIRYVVETVNPQRAHLAIDAVFVTDAGHRLYASDGNVETAEYAEIMIQLKALETPTIPHHKAQPAGAQGQETAGLQNMLADERSRLAEAKSSEQKLQEHVKQLQFNTEGRIRNQGVPLKASPYNHSTTVMRLDKGLTVTVLTTTKYWYRIRTTKGDEGWIYYAFLEPLS